MTEPKRGILLVEDSRDDAELALLALEQADAVASIRRVRDGAEALAVLFGAPWATLPALVLLDIKLPKVGGFEVLRRIRADTRTRFVPTVILSSSDTPEDIERAYALGANSYVRKPVEYTAYAEVVRRVGQYWGAVNTPPCAEGARS
jgi:two-component system response regulator